tara:strand:+ start:497 stop:625 length:129 start_codon:yes stop_codon:yes gene_type:complete
MEKEIVKLINKHMEAIKLHVPWDGQHETLAKKIIKLIKEKSK